MKRRRFIMKVMNMALFIPLRFAGFKGLPELRTNVFFLNPYFLEAYKPSLLPIAKSSWIVNKVAATGGSRFEQMKSMYAPVSQFTEDALLTGKRPIIVAGDCCISIAVLAAFQKIGVDPTLIYFDAHGDFNTPETSPSGFIGGMPLAMLMGLGDQTLMQLCNVKPLKTADVILADGRNLDPGEDKAVAISGIYHYTSLTQLKAHVFRKGPVYVHVDADVINPADTPAMLYPAEGGPRKEELASVFEFLKAHLDIRAISLGAWEPSLDTEDKTKNVCLDLLRNLYH